LTIMVALDRLSAFLDRAMVGAAALGLRRPRLVLGAAAALTALSIASGLGMRFHAEVKDLVPAASREALDRLEGVFGTGESAFLVLRSRAPGAGEGLIKFARSLAERLRAEPLVRSVTFGWEGLEETLFSGELLSLAPLFARGRDLEELDRLLTPEGIAARVEKCAAQLGLPGLGSAEKWVERDPLELRSFFLSRLAALKGSYRFSPGSMHFLSEDGRALLVRVEGNARSSQIPEVKLIVGSIRAAVEAVREEIRGEFPGAGEVEAGMTGGYAFSFESEEAVRGDLTRNITCSLALVVGLVAAAYRRPLLLVPSMVALVAGIVLGFGLFSILRREVVTLAFVAGALLAGLGVDYVIYVTLRVFTEPGGPSTAAVLNAVRATGRPILFAALTTASAFFAFPLSGERFLVDLGLLSGLGILTCMAASLILLPALLSPWARRGDRGGFLDEEKSALRPRDLGAGGVAGLGLRFPRASLLSSALVSLASLACLVIKPPEIEGDLRNVHTGNSEAVRVQEEIAATFGGAKVPLLILVEGEPAEAAGGAAAPEAREDRRGETAALEESARLEPALEALRAGGLIAAWTSPAQLIPRSGEQEEAIRVLSRKSPQEVERAFRSALEAAGFEPGKFEAAGRTLAAALGNRETLGPDRLRKLGLSRELNGLLGSDRGKGYALIVVEPAIPLWRSSEGERLFDALEAAVSGARVRGQVTGVHLVSTRSAAALLREFLRVSGFAVAVVVLLVAVLFRGLLATLFALLPVALGTLWMAAGCDLLGVKLNFMNVGILPLVLGTGVDVGIHMVRLYLDDPQGDVRALVSRIGTSVLLASLTTLASFGTMAFSRNRGLSSVGTISGLGMIGCLLASLVTLTALLELHSRRRGKLRGQAEPAEPLA